MDLLKKLFTIANITVGKILKQRTNKYPIQIKPEFIENEEIISKYNEPNGRIEEIRSSI